MVRSRLLRLSFHLSVLVIASLVLVMDASANATTLLGFHDGITLLYVREENPSLAHLDALEPADAFERITEALILIKQRSRRHYAAIKALDGAVYIRYLPYGFSGDYASSSLALFRQGTGVGELDAASDRNYVAVLGRYVVQWPTAELAGIIVHELVGHGTQAKEGSLRTMTDLRS